MLQKFFSSSRFAKPRKLYKYMDAKGAEDFFKNPSLWFCLPSRLNDIFDLNPVGAHPTQWGGAAILCLSETPTSVPMWAHYGGKGEGMVLEFSVQSDFFQKYPPEKVRYRSKRPTVKNIKRAFLTKNLTWSYECEWRCITSHDLYEFQELLVHHQAISVPFPFEALTAVIYGYDSQVVQSAQSFLTRYEISHVKETRIYSVLSFPRRRESSQIKHLDPHLLGDNELICVSLKNSCAVLMLGGTV